MKNLWFRLWSSVAIVLYLIVVGVWISIPDEVMLNSAVTVFTLGITAALVIIYRDRFALWYESEKFDFQLQILFRAFLVFFIVGILNYLVFKNPLQKDFSRNSINSLSSQSKMILSGVSGPATVTIFGRSQEIPPLKALMELYQLEKKDVTIKKVDVELRPDLYTQNEIQQSPAILIEANGKKEQVIEFSELSITNAFLKLSRKSRPKVYFSIGHNELNLNNPDEDGLSTFKAYLDKYDYEIEEVYLSKISSIPENVSALIIWGPKNAFLDQEVKAIESYLNQGGKLLMALDPMLNEDPFKNLRLMLQKFELNWDQRIVLDLGSYVDGSKGTVPQISTFHPKHEISKNFKGPVFMPFTSAIFKQEVENERGAYTILAQSSSGDKSWLESSPRQMTEENGARFDAKTDQAGPLPIAVSWEEISQNKKRSKIIAFGNSTMILNTYKNFLPHFYLVFNSLNWLTDENRLISLNTPVEQEEIVHITAPHLGVIFYFSVVFLPLLLFGFAIYIYRRRLSL